MNPSEMLNENGSQPPPPTPAASVQILCIEDNDGDFGLIRAYLKHASFPTAIELHRARCMEEACQRFAAGGASAQIDMVLLDLSLPDSFGAETYYRLCAIAPQTAVAILSGNNDQDLALQLVQSGAQDYLPKDALTPDLLMRCITYAMKRQTHRVEMENLTERLRRTTEELKAAQTHLIQAEKLESLGRLASSVAHEVKNPLGVIQMGIDFLEENLAHTDEDVTRTLTLMHEAVVRADCVIHDMLDFSRTENARMELCPLNELVNCVERMLKHECDRRKITFCAELAGDSPVAQCDPNGIEQVLINIVTNALQAMDKGGKVTVRTKRARAADIPRDAGLREMNLLRAGDEVALIEVQDEGPGIPKEIMGRIFDPFFTTKPTGEGTGLGLAICRRVIELHRGQLLVSNVEAPRGLLVSIVLKAETFEPEPESPREEPEEAPALKHQINYYESETNPLH